MEPIKLRNKKLEDEFFAILKLWRKAIKDQRYTEQDLKMLFNKLEHAFKSVGYIFGEREKN